MTTNAPSVRPLSVLLLLVLALSLAGCASRHTEVAPLPAAQAPQWKTGDWWRFSAKTRSPYALAERMEVRSVGDEIVLTGDGDQARKAVLGRDLSVRSSNGSLLAYSVDSGTDAYIFFPLAVGQTRTFTQNASTAKGSASYTNTVTVEASEEVTTPAGTFKTFRIKVQKRNTTGWSGTYTLWYSPEVAYFVRITDTHGHNAVLQEFGRK
ncbi:hypothetical protein NNJEOMEG_02359 [Fundidesulfovibrio magnetotacticus]|uniref:Lipoprotein n=1 Tax=Fundidesulfovibrio magnetotacticus TaxID=2730080 RepID=A0A6V8LPL8_9BACT|nr:hypothetical protein [Fundidesulfovibrio magnetotacticus]GFK94513.1 hypothetical protein NNJEOMEG_02359 [Fundidesulfovibrio magnetotacticus]